MRAVSRLSPLQSLLAKNSDKSLVENLDALVDLLHQVSAAQIHALLDNALHMAPYRSKPWR